MKPVASPDETCRRIQSAQRKNLHTKQNFSEHDGRPRLRRPSFFNYISDLTSIWRSPARCEGFDFETWQRSGYSGFCGDIRLCGQLLDRTSISSLALQVGGVQRGLLEAMAVGDGIGGAGFHAVAAEDAAVVVDVVDLG